MSARPIRSSGFTLVEVIVAVAIVAVLLAVVVPTLAGHRRQADAATLIQTAQHLETAVRLYRTHTGSYPAELAHLVEVPPDGGETLCGRAISTRVRSRWAGPYLATSEDVSGGLPIGPVTVLPALDRPEPSAFALEFAETDEATAREVDALIDGDGDLGAGRIRWDVHPKKAYPRMLYVGRNWNC